MTRYAHGTFSVTITPQANEEGVGDPSIGRMALHKVFDGDMVGSAKGQMLAVRTEVKGSAGYVAMDCVTATIHGRSGGFALQHSGTMDRGAPQLRISVVPDSGTGELAGIVGTLDIEIRDGEHFYHFTYHLPDAD
ncbi:DUF3224 domain-containing protein [Luteimonas aquatica]|uniref:DUF3224 domain-containing protein n=1 Tax=Luteimonas aquatica TaxID=450364 RepID=UPI001F5A08E9|nr:DUF3224 domain-containing protein [Luteimonas aquatica]